MAKAKTKKLWLDTVATETAPGCWAFSTDTWEWLFEHRLGINLFVRHKDPAKWHQGWAPAMCMKDLNQAVVWAWGFEGGHKAGTKSTKAQ